MRRRNSLPLRRGMLERPRVHALIEQGLQHPLLVMLAGPGYGKTQAMAGYLAQSDARTLWLRLGGLDNLPSHFWDHLIYALQQGFPQVAGHLQTLEFPDTPPKLGTFLHILADDFDDRQQVLWVFDDFGEVADQRIRGFFRALADLELENFRLVLISSVFTHAESVAFMSSKRFLVLDKDLRFSAEEIAALYGMHGVALQAGELRDIERYTEGWPLAVHLLALQHGQGPARRDGPLTQHAVAGMFEERFFAPYPRRLQKLLVRLSLLNTFTEEFAAGLYEGDRAELEGLGSHVFLSREPATGRLYFHNLYLLFLRQRQVLLTVEEKRQTQRSAAEYYAQAGNYIDAIGYYRACGDHVGMINAIRDFVRLQHGVQAHGITPENAAFFLEQLDQLTAEELQEHPVADYLRALVYLNTLELDKAEALYRDLEQRLLAGGTPEALELLGDTYAMTGALHMMRSREDFGGYYKKAAGLLPGGTRLQNKSSLLTHNTHIFSLPDNRPGALERMENGFHDGVPWINKVLDGGSSGLEHLYSAEAAYLGYRLDDARQHAWRAIYRAQQFAQHDLVCNAYCLLARIGLLEGDLGEMTRRVQSIGEIAGKYSIGVLSEIRDTALGWYYITLRDLARVPKTILTLAQADKPLLAQGRAIIVYANYLIQTGEYARLVGMLENPVGLYLSGGIWHDRICLYVLLAVGYRKLGNRGAAMHALWTAYDMTCNNGLTTPFIEAEDQMRALVEAARQQQTYKFDPEWLEGIHRQSTAFARRAAGVRAAWQKQNPQRAARNNPLTRREMEILQALSMGLTREEIAARQFISVNTVKTFIRNIYTKLNAANRAEAVSIAITAGYIDVPRT